MAAQLRSFIWLHSAGSTLGLGSPTRPHWKSGNFSTLSGPSSRVTFPLCIVSRSSQRLKAGRDWIWHIVTPSSFYWRKQVSRPAEIPGERRSGEQVQVPMELVTVILPWSYKHIKLKERGHKSELCSRFPNS